MGTVTASPENAANNVNGQCDAGTLVTSERKENLIASLGSVVGLPITGPSKRYGFTFTAQFTMCPGCNTCSHISIRDSSHGNVIDKGFVPIVEFRSIMHDHRRGIGRSNANAIMLKGHHGIIRRGAGSMLF